MNGEERVISNEEKIKIREYITKNYQPQDEYEKIDELERKLDEYGVRLDNGDNLAVMTSLSPTERVLVTINEMAKILGMGDKPIRRLVRENPQADYIHWVGTRAYLKREKFIDVVLSQSTL